MAEGFGSRSPLHIRRFAAAKMFSCALPWLLLYLPVSYSGESSSFQSVPDLENSMYTIINGYPCVRLLNISGEIGCSNPGRAKVVAPIIRFRDAKTLARSSTILLSPDEIPSFFSRISSDSSFTSRIGGVLVEPGAGSRGFSPDEKFPQAKFSPYNASNYQWNPVGSGVMWNSYNFPIFLVSENDSDIVREAAAKNERKKRTFTTNVVEFDLVMQTTKSGIHNSESCLKEEACLPLGGYSVWSSLPPIDISPFKKPKPIILAVAAMDSSSFFRDKCLGAESPISGLISLLAAVDALSHVDAMNELSKQLVFLVFTGEAWGYLGSRRFLLELDLHSDAVSGLNGTLIETILEIGSVGKASSQGGKQFFAHAAGTSSATNKTLKALQYAQNFHKSESIRVSTANTSNPGIPPSSLMAFLRKNAQTSGVVLADFDTAFTNGFYHSHLDNLLNTQSSAIATAATLVAQTLFILASDEKKLNVSAIRNINANASLVEELMGCLLNCDPGLSCRLVKHYILPNSKCPNHYAGVILGDPMAKPYPDYVADDSRFLWNFLADRTSVHSRENAGSSCSHNCSNAGEVCVRSETDAKGDCVISTTRYVPAFSTRLKMESGAWVVLPPNSSDAMGMVDPVWTESNWDVVGLRVYAVQDVTYDNVILVMGVSVTASTYVAIIIIRAFICKLSKQD